MVSTSTRSEDPATAAGWRLFPITIGFDHAFESVHERVPPEHAANHNRPLLPTTASSCVSVDTTSTELGRTTGLSRMAGADHAVEAPHGAVSQALNQSCLARTPTIPSSYRSFDTIAAMLVASTPK